MIKEKGRIIRVEIVAGKRYCDKECMFFAKTGQDCFGCIAFRKKELRKSKGEEPKYFRCDECVEADFGEWVQYENNIS